MSFNCKLVLFYLDFCESKFVGIFIMVGGNSGKYYNLYSLEIPYFPINIFPISLRFLWTFSDISNIENYVFGSKFWIKHWILARDC